MAQAELPQVGSIADVAARLALWGRRAPKGLARVEFVSDFSRQEAVAQLRAVLPQDKPLYEIELPYQQPAIEVVQFLRERLRGLPPGVVSVTGFATAFSDDCALADSLRVLNFHREALADFPLCQIWWMTHPFAEVFLRSIPDLDSWFMLRLDLSEIVAAEAQEVDTQDTPSNRDLDKVRKMSSDYIVRLKRAVESLASAEEVVMLAGVAANLLHNANLENEEKQLLPSLFDEIIPTLVRERIVDEISHLPSPSVTATEMSGPKITSLTVLFRVVAQMYERIEDAAKAEAFYQASLEVAENLDEPWFSDLDFAYYFLAQFYVRQESYHKADDMCKRWLNVQEEADKRPSEYGLHAFYALNELIKVSILLNKYAEVERLYHRSLAKGNQNSNSYPLEVLETKVINFYRQMGRYKEAKALSEQRMKLQSRA